MDNWMSWVTYVSTWTGSMIQKGACRGSRCELRLLRCAGAAGSVSLADIICVLG